MNSKEMKAIDGLSNVVSAPSPTPAYAASVEGMQEKLRAAALDVSLDVVMANITSYDDADDEAPSFKM